MDAHDSADQPRSRHRRRSDLEEEIEEDEFVAGSDTYDDSRYVFRRHRVQDEGRPEVKRPRFADIAIVDGEALPSPTPSCECDSDGTISDTDADDAALAQELLFPCPVCRRAFVSQKAVCGHMRVHDPHRRQQGNRERPLVAPAISGGWAVTGKQGSVGGRSVSPESEGVVNSMAIVVSEPVIDLMPIAFASGSSSVEPNPPIGDAMAIVVASSDNPTNQVVVHPPPSTPQFHEGHQQAAPQVAVVNPQPAAVVQGQLGAAAPPQIVTSLQLAEHQVERTAPPARNEQGWWVCKEKGCDKRYATHQGLGGHMAGHKNRENSEAAAAGLHLGVGGASCAKPAKLHPCKHCPKVFTSGVQLGGHMRKHYEGRVIPKKRGARAEVSASQLASALALALSLPMPMPPAAVEAASAPVAEVAAPAVPGVVRIFGFNVLVTAPPAAAAAEEVSSAVTAPPAAAAAEKVSSAVTAPPAAAAAEEISLVVTETD